MDAATRELVRRRASHRCEYCGMHQDDLPFVTFHVEHVVPLKHGGGDEPENLALACQQCNLHKGPNLSGIDPTTGLVVELFHPRRDAWDDHFERRVGLIVGSTPRGRATVAVCDMNAADRIRLRLECE